ncbi:MAG: hypothetical protein ABEH81_01445 [Halopenitus sp.]
MMTHQGAIFAYNGTVVVLEKDELNYLLQFIEGAVREIDEPIHPIDTWKEKPALGSTCELLTRLDIAEYDERTLLFKE